MSLRPSPSAASRAMSVDALLRPRSVAILGASERPSIGRSVMASLDKLGFEGDVYPINPKYPELLGQRCYPSLADLPEAPDVVAFCVSSARVLDNMRLAAERGAHGAVVYDAGFAEKGEEGRALQEAVTELCRSAGIALCGPNCMGVLNPHARSTTYMQELTDLSALAGNVGLISQSGSICIGMLADVRRFGFSHLISSGNEAVVSAVDYLEALIDAPETKVIALFLESVRQPERFVAALDRAADAGKPVVVLKVGRSERVQRAITSHTGGLAGSSRVFSEVLRAHRAIETHDFDEFTEVIAACQARALADRAAPCRRHLLRRPGGADPRRRDAGRARAAAAAAEDRAEVERVVGPITGDGNPLDAWGNGDVATNLPHALGVLDRGASCDIDRALLRQRRLSADGPPRARAGHRQAFRRGREDERETALPHGHAAGPRDARPARVPQGRTG